MRRLLAKMLLVVLAAVAASAAAPTFAHAACPGEDVQLGRTYDGEVGSTDVAAAEHSMLCLLNEYRVAHGLGPLVLDARLARAARAHAQDMVARRYFAHDTPEGDGPTERARRQGFPGGAGENIAYSAPVTPRSMFELWQNSPGHNQNMLHASYTVVGVGFALGIPTGASRGATGVQNFGRIAVSAGGETGLGRREAQEPCPAGSAAAGSLAAAVQSRRRRVAAALARVRAHQRRLAAARGRSARARARRRLKLSHRALVRARAALSAAQSQARRSCTAQ